MFNKFLNRLFFDVADSEIESLKVLFDQCVSEISKDLQKLKSIDLSKDPICYTNSHLSLKLSSDFVDSETGNVEELKSLVKSCVFANIKLQKEK